MQTGYIVAGIAILWVLMSSNSDNKTPPGVVGQAKQGERQGGVRLLGPATPMPAQAPSGSPGGQTYGASTFGALATNVLANADKIGSGIGDIITAVKSTDQGEQDDVPDSIGPAPANSSDAGSGASWSLFDNDPKAWLAQSSSFDQVVPDFNQGGGWSDAEQT